MGLEQDNQPDHLDQDSPNQDSAESASTTGNIEIIISEDKLICWLNLSKTVKGDVPGVQEVQQMLDEKKIARNLLKKEVLERIFDQGLFDQQIVIAEGKSQKDGERGMVKYYFETDPKSVLKADELGSVDYKETGFIQQVKEGAVVAELIPPKDGIEGLTVTGEVIKAKKYDPEHLPVGKNTAISEKNPNQLVASINGIVTLKHNRVDVDPVLVIDDDIDYSTGNIDYNGAVNIKGGIKAGFSVKAAGDLTVKEIVEDATIESTGNVLLKSGFVGHGDGKIYAEGDVFLTFVENQNIYAKGNIFVSDALLHSTVETDGKVVVSGKKGIVGGLISASESIEVHNAGSDAYTKTILRIGLNRETREKLIQYNIDVQNNKSNIVRIDNMLKKYEQLKRIKHGLPAKEQAQLMKLVAIRKKLTDAAEELKNIKAKLDEAYAKFEQAFIKINQKVCPGVNIEIGHAKMIIQEYMQRTIFKLKGDTISTFRQTR